MAAAVLGAAAALRAFWARCAAVMPAGVHTAESANAEYNAAGASEGADAGAGAGANGANGAKQELQGHDMRVTCLAALADGRLASGSCDATLRVWSLATDAEPIVLRGHAKKVTCITALADGRLASGDSDGKILLWALTGSNPAYEPIDGHEGSILCLAALSDGRLASGGFDDALMVWDLSENAGDTTPLKLMGGGRCARRRVSPRSRRSVCCLAALADGALASGSADGSITVWADDGQDTTPLRGHSGCLTCLAALADGRLASGSMDKTVRVWTFKDGVVGSLVLRGHEYSVQCLAAIADGRLASGGGGGTVRVWPLADGAMETSSLVVWRHTSSVCCLASLDGRLALASGGAAGASSLAMWQQKPPVRYLTALVDEVAASGSKDNAIRVLAAPDAVPYELFKCRSPFEFNALAETWHSDGRVKAKLDASIRTFMSDDVGLPCDGMRVQANVFDAIAAVASGLEDEERKALCGELSEPISKLVDNVELLPDMVQRGASDAAIEQLAPTALFRVVLDAKFDLGPRVVLTFELILFCILMLCFGRVAFLDNIGVVEVFVHEKYFQAAASVMILAFFTGGAIHQMVSKRARELESREKPLSNATGFAWYTLALPRVLLASPFIAVMKLLPKSGLSKLIKDNDIIASIFHDPLTFLGFADAWRRNYWNLIDAAAFCCAWVALALTVIPGMQISEDLAVITMILGYLKFLGFIKNVNIKLATFVLMIEQIVRDLQVFLFFLSLILCGFASAFFLYLGGRDADEFEFHDDAAANEYLNVRGTLYSLYLLAFIGEFDIDQFDNGQTRMLLAAFILIVVVIMLNVLIAIVSESYAFSNLKKEKLFYRARTHSSVPAHDALRERSPVAGFELITEVGDKVSFTALSEKLKFPSLFVPKINERDIANMLDHELKRAQEALRPEEETVRRTRAGVEGDIKRALRETEEKMAAEVREVKQTIKELEQRLLEAVRK